MKKIATLITIMALLLGTFTMPIYAADGDLNYPGDGGYEGFVLQEKCSLDGNDVYIYVTEGGGRVSYRMEDDDTMVLDMYPNSGWRATTFLHYYDGPIVKEENVTFGWGFGDALYFSTPGNPGQHYSTGNSIQINKEWDAVGDYYIYALFFPKLTINSDFVPYKLGEGITEWYNGKNKTFNTFRYKTPINMQVKLNGGNVNEMSIRENNGDEVVLKEGLDYVIKDDILTLFGFALTHPMEINIRGNYMIDVSFDANGGVGTMDNQQFYSDIPQKLNKNQFTRDGYIFDCWSTWADVYYKVREDEQEITFDAYTKDKVTLYAMWIPENYTIIFDAGSSPNAENKPTGTMKPKTLKYEDEYILPEAEFKLEGYQFDSWNTARDGSGGKFEKGQMIKELTKKGSIKLYAQWKPINYTVTFDANKPAGASGEVSGAMADQKFVYDEQQQLTADAYALKGYIFMGWNTKSDGTGTAYTNEQTAKNLTTVDGDVITLYAQWKACDYEITFDAGDGSGTMEPQKMTYDEPEKLNANQFKAPEGKKFAGWKAVDSNNQTEDVIYVDQAEVINQCQYNEDGELTGFVMVAQWKDIPNADNDTPKADDDLPATGDDSPLGLAIAVMLASVLATVAAALVARRGKAS